MKPAILLLFLYAFWLALSGLYKPFLLTLGAITCVLALAMALRLRTIDAEGAPFHLIGRAFTYYPWLVKEIVKSAWSVTKVVLDPRLPISPTMTRVKPGQKTTAGVVTYANSITLTPGTLTVAASNDEFVVHALTRDGAIDVESGGMDRRVSQFEGTA